MLCVGMFKYYFFFWGIGFDLFEAWNLFVVGRAPVTYFF